MREECLSALPASSHEFPATSSATQLPFPFIGRSRADSASSIGAVHATSPSPQCSTSFSHRSCWRFLIETGNGSPAFQDYRRRCKLFSVSSDNTTVKLSRSSQPRLLCRSFVALLSFVLAPLAQSPLRVSFLLLQPFCFGLPTFCPSPLLLRSFVVVFLPSAIKCTYLRREDTDGTFCTDQTATAGSI